MTEEKNLGMYDPPEGWLYGFPKPYRPLEGESLLDTLRRDGYPEKLMKVAEGHTRFWGGAPKPKPAEALAAQILALERGATYLVFASREMPQAEADALQAALRDKAHAQAIVVNDAAGFRLHGLERDAHYLIQTDNRDLPVHVLKYLARHLNRDLGFSATVTDASFRVAESSPFSFDDYDRMLPEADRPGNETFTYPALGACGEGGELFEKAAALAVHLDRLGEFAKKLWRDHGVTDGKQLDGLAATVDEATFQEMTALRDGIRKESGDVLWYLNKINKRLGSTLREVAQSSVDKNAGRTERGTVGGSGDDR